MLELRNIKKDYVSGDLVVHALKGISMVLRDHEFVSVLGPSGCGKTTTLNIIGGLDRYTEGDLLIEGKSTKEYQDKDWDAYRNHKVGFVFQSYNLIPHQTILSNVELALTIGGIPKEKRSSMALDALSKVGLKGEVNKFPRQLSGGQMQRVAIARAIVNHPAVLLADEPTGALDSITSMQVIDILKELSKDCLIVMVTHNEELAKKYSTRIISLNDGEVISDSNPYHPTEEEQKESIEKEKERNKKYLNKKGKIKKVGMPFWTAFMLSLSNLKSKMGRTILTCFAGSIGIIGIALVLSVSNGFNNYIGQVENSVISRYPIEISTQTVDLTSMASSFFTMNKNETSGDTIPKELVPNYVMVHLLETIADSSRSNDLTAFRDYLENNRTTIDPYISNISYDYDVTINAYDATRKDSGGNFEVRKVEPFTLPDGTYYVYSPSFGKSVMENYMRMLPVWDQVYASDDGLVSNTVKEQYNLVAGSWPTKEDEVVYVVDGSGTIADYVLYATGLADSEEGSDLGDAYVLQMFHYVNGDKDENGVAYENPQNDPKYTELFKWTYDDIIYNEEKNTGCAYYVVPEALYYENEGEGLNGVDTFKSIENDDEKVKLLLTDQNSGVIKAKVTGVIIPNKNSDTHSINGTIGYTEALSNAIVSANNNSEIVKYQEDHMDYCISDIASISGYISTKGQTFESIINQINALDIQISSNLLSMLTAKKMLNSYGYVDKSSPVTISIYPKSFEDKEQVISFINAYNSLQTEDSKKITYNDYVGQIWVL